VSRFVGAISHFMLAVEDLSRTYGETVALDGATVSFEAGTVHAILGENGSGKSTLVKLLSGVVRPTRGAILVDRKKVEIFSPAAFQSLGLATVFQEVLVAPDRTALDNIFLGGDGLVRRGVSRARRPAIAAETLASIATTRFDLAAAAGRLPLATQQVVVLARALVRRPRILILDEVTAALYFADRESVFQTIERFARNGGLVLFISHRMDEVQRLADRVTILRNGRVVETLDRASASPSEMLRLMAPAADEEMSHGR
jgi:ribose transport system ATP-binding protein